MTYIIKHLHVKTGVDDAPRKSRVIDNRRLSFEPVCESAFAIEVLDLVILRIVSTQFQRIAEPAEDVVAEGLGLLGDLENAHVGVDLALLADSRGIGIDEHTVNTLEGCLERIGILDRAWKQL